MPKEQTYWCVFSRQGLPVCDTISWQRKDCIKKFIDGLDETWDSWRKKSGYTVQKVTINIVTK